MQILRRYVEIMMQTDIIREKKLKVKETITNVMEYYNSSLIKVITNLSHEFKRLAVEKKRYRTDNQHLLLWGCGLVTGTFALQTLKLSATVQK